MELVTHIPVAGQPASKRVKLMYPI